MRKKSNKERFYNGKFRADPKTGCWVWTAAKTPNGYGVFGMHEKRNEKAHRASYRIHVGEIPDGMFVCHGCDRPLCVNPDHLWVGTPKQNSQDMKRKGRSTAGESHGYARLSESDVFLIRRLREKTGLTYTQLGYAFGVSRATVHLAATGKNWGTV